MSVSYDDRDMGKNPVKDGRSILTEHAAAAVVIGALAALVLIRRGFRGVNVAGVGVSIN